MHSSMGGFLLFFNLQFRSVSVSRGGIFSKAAAAVSGMLSSLGCRPHWDNDSEKHRNGDSKKLSFKQVTRLNIGHRNFECPLIISALAYQSSKKENSSLQGELFLCAHGAAVVQHPTHPPHSPSLAHALRCTHTCTRMARSGSSTLPSTPLPCASPTPPLSVARSHARPKQPATSYRLAPGPARPACACLRSRTSQAFAHCAHARSSRTALLVSTRTSRVHTVPSLLGHSTPILMPAALCWGSDRQEVRFCVCRGGA